MTPKLVIATPVRGATLWATSVSTGYSESVRAVARELGAEVLSATLCFGSEPVRANNRMVDLFLREPAFADATHLLHWDDDQWPEDRRIVQEMMACGADVVSAPYTNKQVPARWIHRPLVPMPEPVNGLLEVHSVGMGFTMTSRACLERMTAHYRKYTDYPNTAKVANIFGHLYDRVIDSDDPEDEAYLSDDFSFCKRWREIGGKCYLFLNSGIVYHAGGYSYTARDVPGGVVG